MWQRVLALRCLLPNRKGWMRILQFSFVIALAVLAFCWGRLYNPSRATATQPTNQAKKKPSAPLIVENVNSATATMGVAEIYGKKLTRQQFGEYLIARFGPERIQLFVHHKIIENACRKRGITVSNAEVEAQLVDELKKMNVPSLEAFTQHVLKRFGKTLYEYKEDKIRPTLALAKFCRHKVKVTEQDLAEAFEAKYGPKVQCKMIAFLKEEGTGKAQKVWEAIKLDPSKFDTFARNQMVQALASKGGEVPPIHKHFGDKRVEKEAFSLKPGQISSILPMTDGTFVILRCEKHLPAAKSSDGLQNKNIRLALYHEVYDKKLNDIIPKVFEALKNEADPSWYLEKRQDVEASLAQRVNMQLRGSMPKAVTPVPFTNNKQLNNSAILPQGN